MKINIYAAALEYTASNTPRRKAIKHSPDKAAKADFARNAPMNLFHWKHSVEHTTKYGFLR